MRSFVIVAAVAALIVAALDGCARPFHPRQPHKEPYAVAVATAGPQDADSAGLTEQPLSASQRP